MDLINDNIQWACNQANFICDRWNINDYRDDYHQAALVGLVEASRKYKGSNNASFKTYAFLWVRGEVIKEIIRNWNVGTLSETAYQIFTNLSHIIRKLGGTFDKDRAAELLSKEINRHVTSDMVVDIYSYMGGNISLDYQQTSDANNMSLIDVVLQDKEDPETLLLQEEQKAQLHQAMQNIELDDLDQEIVVLRMLAEDPMSQADLGSRFKISQQAVAKRETIIIEKLRKEMNICK